MKKNFGFAALLSLFFTVNANAAMYRVDFNGLISDGTLDGYFTYDTAGLNLNGGNISLSTGLETDLEVNFNTTAYTGSFDETTAGVAQLQFLGGNLTAWSIGGNVSGPGAFSTGSGTDFTLNQLVSFIEIASLNDQKIYDSPPQWSVTELSAVPLPAAAWAFGAGLLGLAGLKRRKKAMVAVPA